jgi:hypothetical protein
MAEKICIADTRNQVDDFAVKSIESQGYKVKRMTLPFGDFALIDNLTCAVDIKSSGGGIVEIARNICSKDHERLKREIMKCADWGGEICFLVANNDGITKVEQLAQWKSPCYKSGKLRGKPFTQVKGETLMKAIQTMSQPNYYANGLTVHFSFCSKENAGKKIIEILTYWQKVEKKHLTSQ